MRIALAYGRQQADVEIADGKLLRVTREPIADPVRDLHAAVDNALESPLGFPPLRRALTPDDHVVIVVDDQLTRLPAFLTPLLEHIGKASVAPEAITLLCPATSVSQPWVDELPDEFQDVRLEVHDPDERRHLSYLATTRPGRRIYLNRTAVDADQLVVLSKRGYDPRLGYSGAEAAIFPALSDRATLQEVADKLTMAAPSKNSSPLRHEATEVAWLLGAPFLVQVIEGSENEVAHVVGGPVESSAEGRRLLDARWRIEVEQPADTVIATLPGDPSGQDFATLARALACAARVVKAGGHIVLLTEAKLASGPEIELLRHAGEPGQLLQTLGQQNVPNLAALFEWASAAKHASIYLLSRLPDELAEELFTVPLERAGQVQRVVGSGSCLVIPDAHKTMATLGGYAKLPPQTID
jgi:nickel-dependent lactate racemase